MGNQKDPPIHIGDTIQKQAEKTIHGEYVPMLGEMVYKISNYDAMEPFFMSIVSSSDHWLFIASTGALSAGRVSADQALFPYLTVDRLTENYENTGAKTILLIRRADRTSIWEPFSERQQGVYQLGRAIYKNVAGTALVFEEQNLSLGLIYRYAWRTSDIYGFVKTSWLNNPGDSACTVELVDGVQNILPANVTLVTQNTFSSLLDAYKRNELDPETGLAIFALNSTLTDLAEPSESLLATVVWQVGLEATDHLLSSTQLDRFRAGLGVSTETEVRGRRGAYFVHTSLELTPGEERSWHLVADIGQDNAAIVRLSKKLRQDHLELPGMLENDMASNQENLEKIVAGADGLQVSKDPLCDAHHFANVMFNVMRGGIFADQYRLKTQDFIDFIFEHNRAVLEGQRDFFSELPAQPTIMDLKARAEASHHEDLIRLSHAYLPLIFSRRHGDPSRPWNRFEIKIKKADDSLRLGYEGNWRDIFQNWEALAYSYPEYVESMICVYLNATTADGYNPYRITHAGIDWETPDPGNPWANIGYWSDHQIIYLQKLMEISVRVHPGKLQASLDLPMYSYANVPYRIKAYANLLNDPFNSIEFDWELEREIAASVPEGGTDAKLVHTRDGHVLLASLTEKILTLLLAKLANFVPEGGLWMNTQRPEWNDANNALVGKGLSVVTLCYLRRSIIFWKQLFQQSTSSEVQIRSEVQQFYSRVSRILSQSQGALSGPFDPEQRRRLMDELGEAGSDYRRNIYSQSFQEEFEHVLVTDLLNFLDLAQRFIEHTLRANKRSDSLYHAYNILHLDGGQAVVTPLCEMLEGQVAILSSGLLSGEESRKLLENLRQSQLYCPEQHSYILYPDRDLPGFLEKNSISPAQVESLGLVSALLEAQDNSLLIRDLDGNFHFNGSFRNFKDVRRCLEALKKQPRYAPLVEAEAGKIEELFEVVFRHAEFTGRSGTFFAYEGLGSIYWHMVSKLYLAVQETILRTRAEPSTAALIEIYKDIGKGLSINKSPADYGAFPTDPYSHTPKGQGAKQPGMSGMVKEEILTRQRELGYSIENGQLVFDLLLLDKKELLSAPAIFTWWSVAGEQQQIELKPGSLAFTICQVPVILQSCNADRIWVHGTDGSIQLIEGHALDADNNKHIFHRDGRIHHLVVSC